MTAYRNFVQDFPARCKEVFKLAESQSDRQGREVTLMLIIASAAIIVPYERLRTDSRFPHPSKDNQRFAQASARLTHLLSCKFLDSSLWNLEEARSWKWGKLKSITGDPDSWPELDRLKSVSKDETVCDILKVVRNSLAHGNIYSQGDPVKHLVFISSASRKEWHCIQVSLDDFKLFLNQWFYFVETLDIPQSVVAETIQLAE